MGPGRENRTIRAAVLKNLIAAPTPAADETAPLLDVRVTIAMFFAVITGPLEVLDEARVRFYAPRCHFADDVRFRGTHFTDGSSFEGSTFAGAADFVDVTFASEIHFDDVTFSEGAQFHRVKFTEDAVFDRADFEGTSHTPRAANLFSEVAFAGEASFVFAKFVDRTLFQDVTFTRAARFNGSAFTGNAAFVGATFAGDARFAGATCTDHFTFGNSIFHQDGNFERAFARTWDFDSSSFMGNIDGPIVGSTVSLERALLGARTRIPIVAVKINARSLQATKGAHLIVYCNSVDLGDADFSGHSIVEGVTQWPTSSSRLTMELGGGVAGADNEAIEAFRDALTRELEREAAEGCNLKSLRRCTAGQLALAGVHLDDCNFSGAHALDGMTIGPRCSFKWAPRAWGSVLPGWMYTRRRVIAEEIEWRNAHPFQIRRRKRAAEPHQLSALDIAVIYRHLRKGLEDAKSEPEAADFYYGEMEMRRLAGRDRSRSLNLGSLSQVVERTLLSGYWLVSGYGLRAWRGFAVLCGLLCVAAILFSWFGWAAQPSPDHISAVDLKSGVVSYSHADSTAVGFWTALNFSIRESIALLHANVPSLQTTGSGTVLDILIRFAGPVLLAFIALALRGRVKR
jgi:hypothetical protein